MKTLACLPLAALAAVALISTAAAASDAAGVKHQVQGQKLDSGLGDLPHYRFWADKSGKSPMSTRIAGEKLDSGLGDIVPFSLGKNGKPQGLDVAQRQ